MDESNEDDVASFPTTIVIDNGSASMKYGFITDTTPQCFPTIIARPRGLSVYIAHGVKSFYAGNDALDRGGAVTRKHPIQRSAVVNWDDMEKVWHYILWKLNVLPRFAADYNLSDWPSNTFFLNAVLLADTAIATDENPKGYNYTQREKATQIMMETFNVSALHFAYQSALNVYSSGQLNGISFDSGAGSTRLMAVYEGHGLKHTHKKLDYGGNDVDEYLMKLLNQRGYSFSEYKLRDALNTSAVKEKLGYVALDYAAECMKDKSECNGVYELPDGAVISMSQERFKCTEILFEKGISQLMCNAMANIEDVDCQRLMWNNIVLGGGNSLFSGFNERLQRELKSEEKAVTVNIVAKERRLYNVWTGGCVLASWSDFDDMCLHQAEYDEIGPTRINWQCF